MLCVQMHFNSPFVCNVKYFYISNKKKKNRKFGKVYGSRLQASCSTVQSRTLKNFSQQKKKEAPHAESTLKLKIWKEKERNRVERKE